MWMNAGDAGQETLCLLVSGFADGIAVPSGFNETLLPKDEAASDLSGDIARDAGKLRPLLFENIDLKVVAAAVARAMRPIAKRDAHASQRGFVLNRDLAQHVVGLDAYAKSLHNTVAPQDHPAMMVCDLSAAFPSVRSPWSRLVLRLQGMPCAAMMLVEASDADMPFLLHVGGVYD